MTVENIEIERVLGRFAHSEPVVLAATGSGADVPESWQPIARSDAAEARRMAALSLWNSDFLQLVPDFAQALETELADVRIGHLAGEAVLVYALEHYDDDQRHVVCWIGWDPALSRDAELRFAEAIPDPVRRFYRETHAGFVAPDWMSNGPIPPRHLQTYAEYLGCPEGLPESNWPPDAVDATRLLLLATTADAHLCVSPDLPPGQALTVYGGVPEAPEDFGALLDETMTAQLDEFA
ncbi:hypothetical protein HMPREF0591_2907 [Mycobacterium parascrofulaceum ATCC BAA-614]|uniref:Uncharacterized protein n=1 Tax=Mycobacterium parascrofulaceum ATCC BAA-614 TaxID=525368 RepID=D5P9R3_9MYCO|nr:MULTISPECIES: hypothetical protein [Mycobacterium]EFG77205.1 hypothetical protein HMPREF0591_2907 [Mycobacterium parascrofulaceum ATCC BAA-614]OCB34184.1 hypothetical protein A9X02_00300 [Mycobacterium malmoense]